MSSHQVQSQLETKTLRYVRKMPYLKALIISELQNDVEIYRYINTKDIQFKTPISDNFLNGLRGGMNELFTDFQKQFEKLKTSQDNRESEEAKEEAHDTNYEVSIMYDKYYLRKKEIAENILMIVICDVEQDGYSSTSEFEIPVTSSSFNIGQVDLLFEDYQSDFMELQDCIDDISKQINAM